MLEAGTPGTIRVLIVDDHAVFRDSIARALRSETGIEITGHCGTVDEGLKSARTHPPDVVILDYDLGYERGTRYVREAAEAGLPGAILMLTAFLHEDEARRLLQLGIQGILLKVHPLDVVLEAIRTVARGGIWLDAPFQQLGRAPDAELEATDDALSEREQLVLGLIVRGQSNKEIAGVLNVSEPAVKATLQRLFNKLGVRTRAQLVRVGIERSLVP
ncbi:MAG: response regulator transcription factor [Acidobacteria bacterium]|nr:response regulator transcription factor [Acidobacteriota bacterium]